MDIKTLKIKCDVSQKDIELAEKKVAKLDKYFREPVQCEIRYSERRGRRIAEVTLRSAHLVLRAETEAGEYVQAAEGAIEGIERQIQKNKTRLSKRLRADSFGKGMPETQEDYIPVKRKRFLLETMTEEDAVMQMELIGHTFFLFKNSDVDDLPCVVYKRADGAYGVLIGE